jgi:hypothetical protein
MDGARPNNHQKTFVFTIEDFFNASAGCRYMFRNACGKGAAVPVQTVSPGYQCAQCGVRQFYSWDISEIFASSADYREVMGITLNQSLLISSSGRFRPDGGTMIPEFVLMY